MFVFISQVKLCMTNEYKNIRMLTGSRNNAIGAAFHKAQNHSPFHKVFHNNMNNISFGDNITKQIALTISESETAFYYGHSTLKDMQEYKNCQVRKKNII